MSHRNLQRNRILGLSLAIALLFPSQAAFAHHPFGGTVPSNALTGFLSGLGHPIIGIDHFAFVIATGLLAALWGRRGLIIPLAFVITTLAGTGLHLQNLDLPLAELVIAASVLGFGVLLALPQRVQWVGVAIAATIAGIFHGYAYGEAIIGAEMNPLIAYLAGFGVVQLGIAVGVFTLAQRFWPNLEQVKALPLRFSGFAIAGLGFAFLSGAILG
ncbi:HupE/UreJ family protein [Spirulina sp. CCNP1310]|uniref:HupE/UreJ family protein n=1 Tax=Spirulina sp. CCNP1310 TaxID=3110249 RepID=UPI002B1FC611|nr:HupE/UreJ family protein [Spirulina sp. CCNP1310]MEA5420841.1 HupE/UreJ family protein [Spirulina sp. CCNP1310]